MTSIRKAKKLGIYKPKKYDKSLYRDVQEQINKVNKRLRSLRREGEYNSWASKKLFNRLDDSSMDVLKYNRKGKDKVVLQLRLNKNLTNTNLLNIQKSTRQFLISKTSTPKGIDVTRRNTIDAIRKTLNEKDGKKVTNEDAEFYYDLLGDKSFDSFVDKIGASAMWNLVDASIEKKDTQKGWIERLEMYAMTMNDRGMKTRAKNLYKKYIKPRKVKNSR